MDFDFTEEQQLLRQAVQDFSEKEIAPGAAERDEKKEFPHEQIKKLGELGYMGITMPEEYGGAGLSYLDYTILVEELSRVDASVGVIVSVNNSLYCSGIYKYGTEEQKQKFLIPCANGTGLGAYSLSEAESGTDAAALKLRMLPEGDHYVLNGTKLWVTNGANATHYIVFATLDPELKHKSICALIVERDTEGFKAGKQENKLGIRSSDTTELTFDNVRIPKENLLSKEGQGFNIALGVLDYGRISIGAQAAGIARGAFDAALKYAKERETFGKPIIQHQAIEFKLADMATRIEASRLLLYKAAQLCDQGKPFSMAASMAKLFCSETANYVANEAVQIHGGYGFLQDFPVERYMRDAKVTEIYEGTSEVQRIVIARHLQNG